MILPLDVLASAYDIVDGEDADWQMASRYHKLRSLPEAEEGYRLSLEKTVIAAIIRRALQLLRSTKRITENLREPFTPYGGGEMMLEETLERIIAKDIPDYDDIIMRVRREKAVDVALMMDTSLSMTGEKLALSAVAAAILACKSRVDRYAVVTFESSAKPLKKMREKITVDKVIERLINVPAAGYTNIEDALVKGLEELAGGRMRRKAAVLVTDGKYTAGGDPCEMAARFDRLEVIATKDYNMDLACCERIAAAGGGHVHNVADYSELPEAVYRVLRGVLR
jgi:Mg-chelatase subunit ChlD